MHRRFSPSPLIHSYPASCAHHHLATAVVFCPPSPTVTSHLALVSFLHPLSMSAVTGHPPAMALVLCLLATAVFLRPLAIAAVPCPLATVAVICLLAMAGILGRLATALFLLPLAMVAMVPTVPVLCPLVMVLAPCPLVLQVVSGYPALAVAEAVNLQPATPVVHLPLTSISCPCTCWLLTQGIW